MQKKPKAYKMDAQLQRLVESYCQTQSQDDADSILQELRTRDRMQRGVSSAELDKLIKEYEQMDSHPRSTNTLNVKPNLLLEQGFNIIANEYEQLKRDMGRGLQIIHMIEMWLANIDGRVHSLNHHFSWLEQNKNNYKGPLDSEDNIRNQR
jgi:hypothetical protein